MNILVTGGAGFVGSSLAIALKGKYSAYEITALDNLKRSGSELNLADLKTSGVRFVHGDIRSREDIDSAGPFDVMIEASAEPSVLAGMSGDPSYVINNNLFGSINCFNACLRYKARIIFLSTSRVYPISRIENANFIEEDTRFSFAREQSVSGISAAGIDERLLLDGARSFYGTTKLSSELFLREYEEFYGLQTAVTRFGVIAGPRQMGKTDQGVATLWMARHFWKGGLNYIGYGGTGKQVRDILHIDDLIALIDMQMHHPDKFAGRVFNAGGGLAGSLSLAEMTTLCEEITGNKISIGSVAETRPADLRAYVSNNARITAETGWSPEKDPEIIFSDIFNWLKANEKKLRPILALSGQ